MNLHHASNQPDWDSIPSRERNFWQRLAASTHSIMTPGNIVTILGFAVVIFGLEEILRQHYWAGGISMAIGRLCDIVDGWLAEATGTKSPFGETLDASIDKLEILLTVLVLAFSSVAAPWVLAMLLIPHIIITGIVLRATRRGKRLRPSRAGKFSMATAWLSLLGFVVIAATHASGSSVVTLGVEAVALLSISLGAYAALGYAVRSE